ncbi:MAG: hypothetical protein K6E59_06515 [Bacilli bacterium]|nr:hypothetical protein [Bacilli bacterium]
MEINYDKWEREVYGTSEEKTLRATVVTGEDSKHYVIQLESGVELRLDLVADTHFDNLQLLSDDPWQRSLSIRRPSEEKYEIEFEDEDMDYCVLETTVVRKGNKKKEMANTHKEMPKAVF